MSWPMQTPGQWNPGMAMAPDMNMASYTPEQWAAMQQQNWQQWTQWQQQYAQWQSQYGEKYAQQMQTIQTLGGMPPLPPPTAAPPPAPPPPDNPPPPPHENNQPLYARKPNQPTPVPAPTNNQNRSVQPVNITNLNQASTNSNWSYGQDPSLVSGNAEALKKLAEEERLFDIQFTKWEEEIVKWKKDNVNHPDKQAYKEYEEKFESCRAELLERRQQMNKKKARLLGTAPPPPPPQSAAPSQGNGNTLVPPPLKNTLPNASNVYPNTQHNYINNPGQANAQQQNYVKNHGQAGVQRQNYNNNLIQLHNYGNNPGETNAHQQNYGSQKTNVQQHNYGFNSSQSNYNQSFDNNSIQMTTQHQQNYGNNIQNINKQHQHYGMNTPQNNLDQGGNQFQHQHYTMQNQRSEEVNNSNSGNHDKYDNNTEKYISKDNITTPPKKPSFLLASESNKKGIPGLDLVPETEKSFSINTNQDVIEITDNKPVTMNAGPDYSTISQGINNILGDEKIMNILSMVRGQVGANSLNNQSQLSKNQAGQFDINSQNKPPYEQGYNNQNQQFNNQQYDNRQNNIPYNRQSNNYSIQEKKEAAPQVPNRYMDERQDDSQSQYNYDRNPQYGNEPTYDNVSPRGPPQGRSNIPGHQNENMYGRGPAHSEHQGANDYARRPTGPPERRPLIDNNINTVPPPKSLPKWVDEPMFTPSIIVEYEHKPLRLKARDFIEPVHMFDYNHKSKDEDTKRKDYEREPDDLFSRNLRKSDKDIDYSGQRYSRDSYYRNFERRTPRDDPHSDFRPRPAFREEYDDRRRLDDERRRLDDDRRKLEEDRRRLDSRFDDRRRDDRDKYNRREDLHRERDRDLHHDRVRGREPRREDTRHHRRSHERDTRKRALSRDSDLNDSKKPRDKEPIPADQFVQPKHIVMIDDLLEPPGREMRPQKIVIILRGPPGSGKSYLAKLIRDKEAEHGGTARIMSIDDYFMQEGEVEEKDPNTGKMIKKPTLKYEYDESSEESYINSLKKAFKRSLTDGYFSFLIYDAVNDTLKSYADVWNLSRQNDFQVYICTMELDPHLCYKRNIHNRTLEAIEVICTNFYPTPAHHIQLDATTLLQSGAITEVQMEDADDEVVMEDAQESEVGSVFTSKWEKMDDAAQLARLDGTSKPLRPSQLSMEDYLQLDEWKPTTAKPGKKTVRWADIEESRHQEKMRAIGFVVGQTDWNRMTDPTMGSSALTQTKYIERVRRH